MKQYLLNVLILEKFSYILIRVLRYFTIKHEHFFKICVTVTVN